MSKKARRNNDQTRGPLGILVLMPVIEDICQGSEGLPEPHYITEEAAKRVSERSLPLTLRKLAGIKPNKEIFLHYHPTSGQDLLSRQPLLQIQQGSFTHLMVHQWRFQSCYLPSSLPIVVRLLIKLLRRMHNPLAIGFCLFSVGARDACHKFRQSLCLVQLPRDWCTTHRGTNLCTGDDVSCRKHLAQVVLRKLCFVFPRASLLEVPWSVVLENTSASSRRVKLLGELINPNNGCKAHFHGFFLFLWRNKKALLSNRGSLGFLWQTGGNVVIFLVLRAFALFCWSHVVFR